MRAIREKSDKEQCRDKNNQTLQKNILELIKPEDVHLKIPEVVIYNSSDTKFSRLLTGLNRLLDTNS